MILSNLHKYRMAATENETEVIILLNSASNWPIKETSPPRSLPFLLFNKIYNTRSFCVTMSGVPTQTDRQTDILLTERKSIQT